MILRTLRQPEAPISTPVALVSFLAGLFASVELVGALGLHMVGSHGYTLWSMVIAFMIIFVGTLAVTLFGMTVYARMVWRFRVWRDRTRAGRMLVG